MTNEGLKIKPLDGISDNDEIVNLGRIAAGMAHEVGNPLSTIKGFLQLLKPYLREIHKEEYAEIALDELDRVSEIIYDFLNIVKPLNHKKETASINDMVIRLAKFYESESIVKNVQIKTNIEKEQILVYMNENEMKQVFINLIKNAFEAIEDCPRETGCIEINTEIMDEHAYIHIIDNGCGMSSETEDSMYTPFYSTKSKGSGMGLSICNKIIKEHLGRIYMTTSKGKGTKFTIELPIQQKGKCILSQYNGSKAD